MWLVIETGQYLRLKDNKHKMSSFCGVSANKEARDAQIWLGKKTPVLANIDLPPVLWALLLKATCYIKKSLPLKSSLLRDRVTY